MFEFFFEVLQKISELNLSDEELAILSAVILFRPGTTYLKLINILIMKKHSN